MPIAVLVAALVLAAMTTPAAAQSHPDNVYWDDLFGNPGAGDPHGTSWGPRVRAIAFDGNGIYVAGRFGAMDGVPANNIAFWDGLGWHALGDGVNGEVSALLMYNGKLYVGGTFVYAGGIQCNHIAWWDGQDWFPMYGGVGDIIFSSPIQSIVAFQDDVYVGGGFRTAGTVPFKGLARWDGSRWRDTGYGEQENAAEGTAFAMAADDNVLWVGGYLYDSADYLIAEGLTSFDGTTWSGFDHALRGSVESIVLVGDDLYAGGWFNVALSGVILNNIGKWDGTKWDRMRGGTNGDVHGLYGVGSDVYAIGNFTKAGRTTLNGVARWDGTDWHPLGSGIELRYWNFAIAARPSGEVFCGGGFDYAGDVYSKRIAHWDNPVPYPSTPSPPYNATNQLNSVHLGWTVSGTPNMPSSYDVYLGTDPDPPLVASGHTAQSFVPDTLYDATTYFWKVVAKDGSGNHATGQVWRFTTEDLVTSRLVVSSATGRCDASSDTVTVDVNIEDADMAIDAAGFDLSYDSSTLTLLWCEPGDLTQSWQTFGCADLGTAIRVGGYDLTPIPQGSYGTLARLTFLANCCGVDSTVTTALTPFNLIDDLAGLRPIEGDYTCEYFVADGDANGDGVVTSGDAYCAFESYMSYPVPLPNDCATSGWDVRGDVDCNGQVTPGDARCILSQWLEGNCSFCGTTVTGIRQTPSAGPADVIIQEVLRSGHNILVRIAVSGAPSLDALGFEVAYSDDVLEYDAAARTNLTREFEQFDDVLVEAGCVRFGGYRTSPYDASAATEITEVRFWMLSDTPEGTVTVQSYVDDLEGAQTVSVNLAEVIGVKPQAGRFALHQNHPNPFNPDTEIRYEIPGGTTGRVTLMIYNIEGKLVRRLVDDIQGAGAHHARWQGQNDSGQAVASGVYFYVLRAGRAAQARKLVLLK
jgi:hypothetical protein